MTRPWPRSADRRPGLTLVELIVVMTIIVVLATLAAAVVPKAQERQRATNAAGQVQSWLGIAKQWALRDQAPRGIRLIPNSLGLVDTLIYIEQPDDFTGGQVGITNNIADSQGSVDFSGGFSGQGAAALPSWPVQVGDYLVMQDGGTTASLVFRVTGVNPGNPSQLTLDRAVTLPMPPTTTYRIVRQPRPRSGEAELQLPDDIDIDVNTNSWYGNPLPPSVNTPGAYDILFDSTGAVIGSGSGNAMIQLWVRDISQDQVGQTFGGDQTLVTIYIRTGMITSNQVDLTSSNGTSYDHPYSFTQDGRGSGL